MSCDHVCLECLEQQKKVVALVMELDSYLSLLRHRHIPRTTPDDLIRDIDRLLAKAHGFEKLGRFGE